MSFVHASFHKLPSKLGKWTFNASLFSCVLPCLFVQILKLLSDGKFSISVQAHKTQSQIIYINIHSKIIINLTVTGQVKMASTMCDLADYYKCSVSKEIVII